jgi:hypothetical protein
MALNPVRRLVAVILLISACPLWASAQIDGSASESQRGFKYSAEWTRRTQKTTNDRGGGALDGGGANVTAGGELLDKYGRTDLSKLDANALRGIVETEFSARLQNLETEMPGFKVWLMAALKLPWYLDPKPLNPELCQNATLHKGKNLIAACQDLRRVHVNRKWYQEAVVDKRKTVAGVLVHEFVRYHVIHLARTMQIARSEQDGITEEVTSAILSDSAVSEVKPLLMSTGLVLKDIDVDILRMHDQLTLLKMITESRKIMISYIQNCPSFPREKRQDYYNLFVGYIGVHENEIRLYNQTLNAEERAKKEHDYMSDVPAYIEHMQLACMK